MTAVDPRTLLRNLATAYPSSADRAYVSDLVAAALAAERAAAWNALLGQLRARHDGCCDHCTAVLRDAARLVRMGIERGAAALAAAGQAPEPICGQRGGPDDALVCTKTPGHVADGDPWHNLVPDAGQAPAPQPCTDQLRAELEDQRAAKTTAAAAADRFRDVLSEALGFPDENPGDDVLVATLREHFGKTGPEPTRWRDFLVGARAQVDQINAELLSAAPQPETAPDAESTDACRPVSLPDGEVIRVHGGGEMDDTDRQYLAEVVAAAKAKFEHDHPDGPPEPRRRPCRITRPHPHHLGCPGITTAEHYAQHPPTGTIRLPQTPETDRD